MEMVLRNGFCEMTSEEMEFLTGGGWAQFGYIFGGGLLIAASPYVAYVNVAGGVGVFGMGLAAIGKGCH